VDTTDKYIGRLLDNRYEILEKIGTGGMAVVYKARCHRLNRLVAVKILKEELAEDADFRRRFHTESQAVAMLSHPNIVAVYDVSKTAGIDYIVMELIEGITLKQYINRKGLLGWKESLHFAMQIAKAVSHAHSKGIIHRDIKPHNIMILKDGSIKVADFGIARLVATANTLTQESLGSVHYISPEQAKGGHVDARTDIYSLGVVMYEMLTSHLPFVGDSAVSVAIQHISSIPLMPRDINPEIPLGLEDITMHAMEPKLAARYATADELLLDLEEFRKNPAITFEYALPAMDISEPGITKPVPSPAEIANAELPKNAARPAAKSQKKGGILGFGAKNQAPERPPSHAASSPSRAPVRTGGGRANYRDNRKKASATSVMIAALGGLVAIVLAVLFMWNYILKDMFSPPVEYIEIPDFIGEVYNDIRQNADFSFIISEDSNFSEVYEAGKIYDQNPRGGTRATPGDGKIVITVFVSKGKRPMPSMPNLVGQDYRAAQNAINDINNDNPELNLKLEVALVPVVSDSITKDLVISTIPEFGESLSPNTTVTITYSEGPEIVTVRVPDLSGYTLSAAKLELQSRDLVVGNVEYIDSDEPRDTVVFNTQVGEEVPERTAINLQVSNGPPETPTPEPPEEETPPPTDLPSDPDTPTPPDISVDGPRDPDTVDALPAV